MPSQRDRASLFKSAVFHTHYIQYLQCNVGRGGGHHRSCLVPMSFGPLVCDVPSVSCETFTWKGQQYQQWNPEGHHAELCTSEWQWLQAWFKVEQSGSQSGTDLSQITASVNYFLDRIRIVFIKSCGYGLYEWAVMQWLGCMQNEIIVFP
jgi:hypothetical protein